MTRADKVIAFIERYCRVPEGALVGQPIKLAPFQLQFIREVYDNPHGTSQGQLSISRKNAKTATIACLVLVHLVGPEALLNSQIISGAMSREQAAIVYKLAEKMVNLNPDLAAIIKPIPSNKTLIGLPMNVEYKAISAESATAHGLSPVVAILDEIGQVKGPQSDFVDAITTAQGAHENPLLLAISTQAPTDGDLWSIWLDDAKTSQDPHIVSHLYAADPDADIMDREQWAKANPALGLFRSLKDLEKHAERASRMPSYENTFRNLMLNQRVSTSSPFVSRSVWEQCGRHLDLDPSLPVFAGLDLSARTDLTALILVQPQAKGMAVRPYFWTPAEGLRDRSKRDRVPYDVWARQGYLLTTPGRTVNYEFVAETMGEIFSDFETDTIAYDRWRIDILKKELEDLGIELPLVPFGQGYKDMSPALDSLEDLCLNGRLAHGMNPVLTMCAANAVTTQDPAGNRKLDKPNANGRIDGMVALAMAVGVSAGTYEADGPEETYLSDHDLVVL
nr:phage terminase [bacterium]